MKLKGLLGKPGTDLLLSLMIFLLTLFIFVMSPVHEVTDSHYSMLLSETLLKHGSFELDRYSIPRQKPYRYGDAYLNGDIYQLEMVGSHLYYYFPPGTSVLSMPFVGVMNLFGVSAANADGTYHEQGERRIEMWLAAVLMAVLAVIFFRISRLLLPLTSSAVVALGGSLGTQVWSTASRVMWSHTWEILLLGLVIFILIAEAVGKYKMRPIVLASLLSWMYFVRPTSNVVIIVTSAYVLLYHRSLFIRYAITGLLWFGVFVIYSWKHFGKILPNYYQANRLGFSEVPVAFAGNLISPSRGLLVYVPVILFVVHLLVRYRKQLIFPRLLFLMLIVVAGHLLLIASFSPWNGGYGYGPRLSTDLVPWFVLAGIFGLSGSAAARTNEGAPEPLTKNKLRLISGGALLLLSVAINGWGANSIETARWNEYPANIGKTPERVWDWRHPQLLAGLISPAPAGEAFVALPPGAYRADISVADPPAELHPDQQMTIQVKVRNTGNSKWPAWGLTNGKFAVRIGDHWLNLQGDALIIDDGRAPLPRDIGPGEEIIVPLRIRAPKQPGTYILEIDLLQELVAWFGDEGSKTARFQVMVR